MQLTDLARQAADSVAVLDESTLPLELYYRIIALVRDPHTDYWLAQSTLAAASLVHSSWTVEAQRQLAYEVQFIRRPRTVPRQPPDRAPRTITERFAQPWLQSSARESGRCRALTLPARLADVSVDDVLSVCEGVTELSVEAWKEWEMLAHPSLKDLKVLKVDASLHDGTEWPAEPPILPFQLAHFVYHDTSELTPAFLNAIRATSKDTLASLSLNFAFRGIPAVMNHVLPSILPTIRHLAIFGSAFNSANRLHFRHCTRLSTLSVLGPLPWSVVPEAAALLDELPQDLQLDLFTIGWEEEVTPYRRGWRSRPALRQLLEHRMLQNTRAHVVLPDKIIRVALSASERDGERLFYD